MHHYSDLFTVTKMLQYNKVEDDGMSIFGERLRQVRASRGITQEELADRADIARTMVGRYETTEQLPAIDTLVRIADALDTSTDCLLGRTPIVDADIDKTDNKPKNPLNKMPKSYAELSELIRHIIQEEMQRNITH